MQSVEDFTDSAVAALIDGLDAALTAIESAYTGVAHKDVGLAPRPRTVDGEAGYGDYYPGGCGTIIRYPTIEVAVPDLNGGDFSVQEHESDAEPTLIVRAWLEHAKFPTLYRHCCRYGAAIYNVLANPDASGRGSGFGADVEIKRYTLRWRAVPQSDEDPRKEFQAATILTFYLDAPDVRP